MDDIRTAMPVLARHEGLWEGVYVHVDPANRELDRHASRLQCSFPAEGPFAYLQVNTYTWADGREEVIHFPAAYRDRAIWFDTERIRGRAWEVDPRTLMLTWTRRDLPDAYLYEQIQISADNTARARTWQWFENDRLSKRTCIVERRIG